MSHSKVVERILAFSDRFQYMEPCIPMRMGGRMLPSGVANKSLHTDTEARRRETLKVCPAQRR